MSATPARNQKPVPLLLPGIAPHLFQSRAASRSQRPHPMLYKDSATGPVLDHDSDHPRTPSEGSTVVTTTQEDSGTRSKLALRTEIGAIIREELRNEIGAIIRQELQQFRIERESWTTQILRALAVGLHNGWDRVLHALQSIILFFVMGHIQIP
ncbi:hypothetical protein C8R45DRAFT_1105653 [Mycena sanguinolenta]|nr:hypothetical protein C8R45DRAFT_1105653 [Mycena sanguinolenta]